MIKSELINLLAEQNPHLHHADVEKLVNTILGRIAEALAAGDRVELRGFGSFSLRRRASRRGRNPKTGEHVDVESKVALAFKPGREMQLRLNGGVKPGTRTLDEGLREAS